MEISSEKITIDQLLTLKKCNMLTVNPEYQRGAVWSEIQQKKLIDSVMRGYPLPLIYLHYKHTSVAGFKSENLEIIDGQQRINALFFFSEGSFKLFDPVKDDKVARFPNFIKAQKCPWAGCDFIQLPQDLKDKFLKTELFIVKIYTDIEDEARDLFIRLQAGLPLNAQEKRDAWPGGFTELVLKIGGKQEIARYQGHDFFRKLIKSNKTDRGEKRQLCAQISMLLLERNTENNVGLISVGTQSIDDYYYKNLDFKFDSHETNRIKLILDKALETFSNGASPKFKAHEAIHITLLIDDLINEYTKNWQNLFLKAYDEFQKNASIAKKDRTGEFWYEYGALVQTSSAEAKTIERRHAFFAKKMIEIIKPTRLDVTRAYSDLDRRIIYYTNDKKCPVCNQEIIWDELEIHHVDEHQHGGETSHENAAPVHKKCHPKSKKDTEEFRLKFNKIKQSKLPINSDELLREFEN